MAPFRNPLALPDKPKSKDVDQLRTPDYNNAWLRACSYQMLFSFQAFGLSCFTLAAFGFRTWTIALVRTCSLGQTSTQRPVSRTSVEPQPALDLALAFCLPERVIAAN